MKFHIKTYGCQMNERDSESAAILLTRQGFTETSREARADILIVNTCSVRGKAEDKAIGKLGLLAAGKRDHPGRIVGAIGCVAQQMKHEMLRKVPGLDFVVGTQRLAALPAVIARVMEGQRPVLETGDGNEETYRLDGHRPGAISSFTNILFGCNRRCAYCVVPAVRGNEWSRPADRVIAEVSELARGGVREVTLLGQSVMSYGRTNAVWPEGAASPRGFTEPLPRLLEALDGLPGLSRVRFTSGHPSGCTPELARAMGELDTVCEHLHLPMQSASDPILARMRRGYTADDYRHAVARLRAAMPQFAITTDIIVGFPGETTEDFDRTRAFMDEMGFDNAFIFKYSPRPGTEAEKLKDDVADTEKRRRNAVLLEDQDRRGLAINERLVGETLEVLVEGVSLRNEARWSGRTRTNKIAIFSPSESVKAGDTIAVKIERAAAQTLYGTVT